MYEIVDYIKSGENILQYVFLIFFVLVFIYFIFNGILFYNFLLLQNKDEEFVFLLQVYDIIVFVCSFFSYIF